MSLEIEKFFPFIIITAHTQHMHTQISPSHTHITVKEDVLSTPDIVEVIDGPQFRDASLQHHGQHVDEQAGMATENQVRILTQSDKPVNNKHKCISKTTNIRAKVGSIRVLEWSHLLKPKCLSMIISKS